jgi:hypothetical protein
MILTTLGLMDESLLIKREGLIENESESTSTVEYCVSGCRGVAHVTGLADSLSHFCNQHVHRSVHVTVKKIDAVESAIAQL